MQPANQLTHQIFLSFNQKNDPITQLKTLLEEKECELKNETENHERAKARIAAMRDEFNSNAANAVQLQSKLDQLAVETKKLEDRLSEEVKKSGELEKRVQHYETLTKAVSWRLCLISNFETCHCVANRGFFLKN